jgi:hypothetical protein
LEKIEMQDESELFRIQSSSGRWKGHGTGQRCRSRLVAII